MSGQHAAHVGCFEAALDQWIAEQERSRPLAPPYGTFAPPVPLANTAMRADPAARAQPRSARPLRLGLAAAGLLVLAGGAAAAVSLSANGASDAQNIAAVVSIEIPPLPVAEASARADLAPRTAVPSPAVAPLPAPSATGTPAEPPLPRPNPHRA